MDRPRFPIGDLESALGRSAKVRLGPDGRCRLTAPVAAPPRLSALIAAAENRDYTYTEIVQLLVDLGYTRTCGTGNSLRRHPLIEHVSSSRWRVIGVAKAAGLPDGR